VISPNEFWLNLHRLAQAYDGEGLTTDERAENIMEQFRCMPHVARRQLLIELRSVVVNLPDLYPLAVAVANEAETGAQKPRKNVG